jgi:hypothetical protein
LVEIGLQQCRLIVHAEPLCPSNYRTVARDFVVLDRLSRSDHASIARFRIITFLDDLLGLVDDTIDGFAGYAAGLEIKSLEDLFQVGYLALRLFLMVVEGIAKVFRIGLLRHLRQIIQDLVFRVVHVAEEVLEQAIEIIHGAFLMLGAGGRWNSAPSTREACNCSLERRLRYRCYLP